MTVEGDDTLPKNWKLPYRQAMVQMVESAYLTGASDQARSYLERLKKGLTNIDPEQAIAMLTRRPKH